jgi:hypothetical protein
MSYILKALNQADADRRRGQTPDVLSPAATSPGEKSRSNMLTILAVVLALNSAVLAYLYWPQSRDQALPQTRDTVPAPAQPAPAQPAPTKPTQAADTPRKSDAQHPSANRLLAETRVAARPRPTQPETEKELASGQGRERRQQAPTADPAADRKPVVETSSSAPTSRRPDGAADTAPRPAATGTSAAPQRADSREIEVPAPAAIANRTATEQERVPLLHELTHDIQSQLPPLQVNVISYSEVPGRRFAIINMKKYREGDKLADSTVSVHRITRDSAILDYGAGLARLPGGIR